MILPLNPNHTADMVIRQRVPRSHRQVEVVLVTSLAGVFNSHRDRFAFATYAPIGGRPSVGKSDLPATVRARGALGHPVGAEGNSEGDIGAIFSARTYPTVAIGIYGSNPSMRNTVASTLSKRIKPDVK